MPFQKGHPRYGGKKLKSKNKLTRDVAGLLDSIQCNPIEGLALLAMNAEMEPTVRAYCYGRLARLVAPELKAIEHSGSIKTGIDSGSGSPVERILLELAETANSGNPNPSGGPDETVRTGEPPDGMGLPCAGEPETTRNATGGHPAT